MSAVQQLDIDPVLTDVDPDELHAFTFAQATAFADEIKAYGLGEQDNFKERTFYLRNPFDKLFESALVSILEIEALESYETADEAVIVYKVDDAFIFREETATCVGRTATYTAYIDCV